VTRKPVFFIVGAPKCGTTAMDHYLAAHPDVFLARKEMHYFGSDLQFTSRFYRRDEAAYLAEFEGWKNQRCAGESSVWYLYSQKAASEIKAFNPDAKIIIMLREPAEMLHSLYLQFRFDGNEHLPTFEEALAAEPDRREGQRLGRGTYLPQGLLYRETARYTEQINRYLEVFSRDRVRVILYEDLATDPRTIYRKILEFLEVDPHHMEPGGFKVINGHKSVKSGLMQKVISDPLIRSTALKVGRKLPRSIFIALQRAEVRLWKSNTRLERRPPIPSDIAARLKREFEPEVQRLSELLGRDLSHWNKPVPEAAKAQRSVTVRLPQVRRAPMMQQARTA
jgi:hypothetical protein